MRYQNGVRGRVRFPPPKEGSKKAADTAITPAMTMDF